MPNIRQDSWTSEDDKFLADTLISIVKSGGTQLEAFEIVGKQLSRTSAAVGFRWNSKVRKEYSKEIREAKKQRKTDKSIVEQANIETASEQVVVHVENKESKSEQPYVITHEDVIRYLNDKNKLQRKYDELAQKYEELTIDYEELMEIFNRAKEVQKSIQSFALSSASRNDKLG